MKRGAWPLEAIRREAEETQADMKQTKADSVLPDDPDVEAVNRLVTDQVWRHIEHAMT